MHPKNALMPRILGDVWEWEWVWAMWMCGCDAEMHDETNDGVQLASEEVTQCPNPGSGIMPTVPRGRGLFFAALGMGFGLHIQVADGE